VLTVNLGASHRARWWPLQAAVQQTDDGPQRSSVSARAARVAGNARIFDVNMVTVGPLQIL